jgi:hypothetical protein
LRRKAFRMKRRKVLKASQTFHGTNVSAHALHISRQG